MLHATPALTPVPGAEAFWRWGRGLLAAALGAGVALVLLLSYLAPHLLPLLLVALVVVPAGIVLFQYPLLNFVVVLAGFVAVSGFEAGIQIEEVVYGLYYMAYLAHWYLMRLFVYRERILYGTSDVLMLFFLVWASASVGLTILFRGSLSTAFGEWTAISMLAFYFPVKEVCVRYRKAPLILLGLLFWLGIYVSVRNVLAFQEKIASAEYAWQIARGRVVTNETFLLLPGLATLVLSVYFRSWRVRVPLLVGFSIFMAALLLTQSRAYWVDFALGGALLFVLTGRVQKKRLLWLGVLGTVGFVLMLYLLFGKFILLLGYGIIERLFSLEGATTKDISLVNRFFETRAVWDLIRHNPIIGYGMGAYYQVFDIIENATITKAYVHNGYLGVWYRYGLIGLVPLLWLWAYGAWTAFRLFRERQAGQWVRLSALIVLLSLVSLAPSAAASAAFYLSDSTYAFALLTAWVAGLRQRVALEARLFPAAS